MDDARGAAGRAMLSKVPEITIWFWILKLLTTAMGEATSDFLVFHVNPYFAVCAGALAFVGALILQMSMRRYIPWVYWLMVAMVGVFGTMAADVLHVVLGMPYYLSAGLYAVALAVVLTAWWLSERTLSIHSIFTVRREAFYWATVFATFALGTAAGDLTATTLHFGYFPSGVLFAALFALPGIGYWRFGFNAVFAFWFAYVMTRPLGASFADWTDKPQSMSGLGYGTGPVALILTAVLVVLVAYVSLRRIDMPRTPETAPIRVRA